MWSCSNCVKRPFSTVKAGLVVWGDAGGCWVCVGCVLGGVFAEFVVVLGGVAVKMLQIVTDEAFLCVFVHFNVFLW